MADEPTNVNPDGNPAPGGTATLPADGGDPPQPTNAIQGDTSPPADPQPAPGGPPDKYELAVPEGSKLEAGYADEIATYSKEQGLSNAQAQALLDRDAQLLAGAQEQQEAQIDRQRTEWIGNLKADKEFGGANYERTVALAQRAWKKFGPADVDLGPFGDNDVLIKTLAAVGKVMHEDTLITGGVKVKPQKKTVAQRMYPGME